MKKKNRKEVSRKWDEMKRRMKETEETSEVSDEEIEAEELRIAQAETESLPAGYWIAALLTEMPLHQVVQFTMKMSKVDEATALEIVMAVEKHGPELKDNN